MKSESGLWREMLHAVRLVAGVGPDSKGEPVTSAQLAEHLNIETKTASAWLCILAKYGYLQRAGKETVSGRWGYLWKLTKFGLEYRPKAKKAVRPAPLSALRIAANPGKKK